MSYTMQATTIDIDLSKNGFQVHGITEGEDVIFNHPLRRAQLLPLFSHIEPIRFIYGPMVRMGS
jgi:transposase